MESEGLKYNNLSYFMLCIDRYIKANHLNPYGWQVVSIGTGRGYNSWHYNITIQAPDGMEKTIHIPMYFEGRDNFDTYFINESCAPKIF